MTDKSPVTHPYPAYKPSGIDWLSGTPEHWETRRLKYLLQERDDRSPDGREQLLRVSQYTGVTQRKQIAGRGGPDTRAESLVGYKRVRRYDLVVNIMLAWNGSMGVSQFHGITSPAYCVYRFLAGTDPWYFHHLLRSPAYKAYIKSESTGVVESRLRLYTDDLFQLHAPVPPLVEQTAIVRYLDHVDRRVRRYVGAKRKLIGLLEEEKQAVINQAVTRGLDPSVPLKPSGVEWLGDVPEHWEVRRLKRILHRLIDCEHKTAPAVTASSYRVVRTSAVRGGSLSIAGTYCTSEEAFAEWTRRGIPKPGDVIFTREAPAGEACVVPGNLSLCLGQRTVLMKVDRSAYDPHFLVHMLYAGPPHDEIELASRGSTVPHFNVQDIGVLPVLTPPVAEQAAIVRYLDCETAAIDAAIARTHRQIELIEEYRTRLIADVVTGKLDVREAAAGLPDEPEVDDAP